MWADYQARPDESRRDAVRPRSRPCRLITRIRLSNHNSRSLRHRQGQHDAFRASVRYRLEQRPDGGLSVATSPRTQHRHPTAAGPNKLEVNSPDIALPEVHPEQSPQPDHIPQPEPIPEPTQLPPPDTPIRRGRRPDHRFRPSFASPSPRRSDNPRGQDTSGRAASRQEIPRHGDARAARSRLPGPAARRA